MYVTSQDVTDTGHGQESVTTTTTTTKRRVRHLSHTSLTFILERGRPVTRRVLVASSPLYQPVDRMERLGYEVRIYIRVPDLGDGMDRDHKDRQSNKTLARSNTHSGLTSKSSKRHSTGAFSASNSGSGSGSGYGSATAQRIRYREQGVDELLQLKLHQAIAATDDVPEGSTIVLATGDGNVGQFNEDGFLGPVRTALKRGWRVELYSWEGALSRAWKKEFGAKSEWGKTGTFRVIGMEQFALSLVEDGWVSV
ncbi:hypothetical protein AMATHDRAFT_142178 [Amanita thiersii Skay4041]|uniref:NYN domain-containing protein n=1 Tax=Amanita thiersii Skay4041 TaxID=703135 RepID=A0A2A9NVA5_9AGAR|nr:hypothetical protein AMATHDRAFT_142178 [Amanita thiersii Skay4041]